MPATVGELVHPLGPTICHTQALETAARVLEETGTEYVTVINLSDRPIGVITYQEIASLHELPTERWAAKRCAGAVKIKPYLSVEDSVAAVVELFTQDEVWPLLVFDGGKGVGVLPPSEVFQWAAEHEPAVLDQLADRVSHGGSAALRCDR